MPDVCLDLHATRSIKVESHHILRFEVISWKSQNSHKRCLCLRIEDLACVWVVVEASDVDVASVARRDIRWKAAYCCCPGVREGQVAAL